MASGDVLTGDFKATPYWWDLAPRPEGTEAGPPAEAETVIVGAGNVGLSAALTLARHGSDVVVLDAEAAGHGASTRNAGYLGRQVWHKYGEMVPKLGRERAAEVCRAAIAAHDYASSLIEKEQIACFYRNTGRFIATPSKRVFDSLARDLAMMREDGVPVDAEMVEPDEAPAVYRKGRYHGGQILRGNGTIHPGLYHAGLLERATREGAQIIGHCPVQAIERAGSGFRISTPRGTVRAGHVIVATNGYTPKAAQWLRRRVVPVDAFMIATEPLPPERVEDIAPGARPMLEHRYSPCWLRPNEDGTRILFGGLSAEPPADLERKARTLRDAMVHIVPALEGVKISHCWTGKTAFTFDMMPHTGSHDGVEYAMGWCGSGVPMGTYLGHKTALRVLGDPEAKSAFDGRPFPTKPFYTGRPWFMPLAVAWHKRKDRKLFKG